MIVDLAVNKIWFIKGGQYKLKPCSAGPGHETELTFILTLESSRKHFFYKRQLASLDKFPVLEFQKC